MLEVIDESLEALFRASVPLSATEIDVSFEPPERDWSAKLTRPTVNVFLWDIRRSASRSRAGVRTIERDGLTLHETAPPVLELRYIVTAWTSDHGDERALLGGVLRSILTHPRLPREFLGDGFDSLDEPHVTVLRAGEDHVDVFRALEGQLKPCINMMVVTEFDIGGTRPAGPPVAAIETAVGRRDGAAPAPRRRRVAGQVIDPTAVGAVVRSPVDATRVNSAGQFLLRAAEGDPIVLDVDPPLTAVVPASGGVVLG